MAQTNPATWMADLFPFICKRKLSELFIPGSHDSPITFDCLSESYAVKGIRLPTEWGPDADASTRGMWAQSVVRSIARNWAVTQSLPLEEQLAAGIRYFDLRIAKVDDEFKFTHALISRLDVFTMLEPVREFMHHHPGEVLILHCQHFFNMQDDYENLLRLFQSFFHDMLVPSAMAQTECFSAYIQSGKRIVLVWGDGATKSLKDSSLVCDQSAFLSSPWVPEHMKNKEDLAKFLLQTQNDRPTPDSRLSVIQCILDIDDFRSQLWPYIFYVDLLNYERDMHAYIRDEVLYKLDTARGFIYMMDDVLSPDDRAIQKVISLNAVIER